MEQCRITNGNSEKNNGRIRWLDAWKGFAMLLVVLGHIADGYLDAGLFDTHSNILQTVYDVIYSFHMPLFFVLSGYAFYIAYAKKREEKKIKFYAQLWNIVWVYVLFSIIQWVFKMLFAAQVNSTYTLTDLLMIPVKTMAPYWYLYVLVFLYLIAWAAEKGKQPEFIKVIFFLGISFLSELVSNGIFFEIKRILYYSVFFYLGIYFAKSAAPVLKEKTTTFCELYRKIPKTGILRFIGNYSMEIYVMHCFITAANRMLLLKLGITNFYFNVIVNLLMATFLPVLAAVVLKKWKLHGWIFCPATTLYQKINRKNR